VSTPARSPTVTPTAFIRSRTDRSYGASRGHRAFIIGPGLQGNGRTGHASDSQPDSAFSAAGDRGDLPLRGVDLDLVGRPSHEARGGPLARLADPQSGPAGNCDGCHHLGALPGVLGTLARRGAERVLGAFAGLLVVFVHTLPRVLLAGVIALGRLWMMNHLDNSMMRVPMSLQVWQQQPQQP
jgi:hypothetical protein